MDGLDEKTGAATGINRRAPIFFVRLVNLKGGDSKLYRVVDHDLL